MRDFRIGGMKRCLAALMAIALAAFIPWMLSGCADEWDVPEPEEEPPARPAEPLM